MINYKGEAMIIRMVSTLFFLSLLSIQPGIAVDQPHDAAELHTTLDQNGTNELKEEKRNLGYIERIVQTIKTYPKTTLGASTVIAIIIYFLNNPPGGGGAAGSASMSQHVQPLRANVGSNNKSRHQDQDMSVHSHTKSYKKFDLVNKFNLVNRKPRFNDHWMGTKADNETFFQKVFDPAINSKNPTADPYVETLKIPDEIIYPEKKLNTKNNLSLQDSDSKQISLHPFFLKFSPVLKKQLQSSMKKNQTKMSYPAHFVKSALYLAAICDKLIETYQNDSIGYFNALAFKLVKNTVKDKRLVAIRKCLQEDFWKFIECHNYYQVVSRKNPYFKKRYKKEKIQQADLNLLALAFIFDKRLKKSLTNKSKFFFSKKEKSSNSITDPLYNFKTHLIRAYEHTYWRTRSTEEETSHRSEHLKICNELDIDLDEHPKLNIMHR